MINKVSRVKESLFNEHADGAVTRQKKYCEVSYDKIFFRFIKYKASDVKCNLKLLTNYR